MFREGEITVFAPSVSQKVIVAIDDDRIRERIVELLNSRAMIPAVVGTARSILELDPIHGKGVVYAGADIATLVQSVWEIYSHTGYTATLPIVALVPAGSFKTNWKRGFWKIDGHDAVASLLEYRRREESIVVELLTRIAIG